MSRSDPHVAFQSKRNEMRKHRRVSDIERKQRHPRVAKGPAEVLNIEQIRKTRDFIRNFSTQPEADELKLLLSFRAGLRVGEIAAIDMRAFLDADNRVREMIEIRAEWTKTQARRSIPMHPEIRHAIDRFRKRFPGTMHVAVRATTAGVRRQSANALCHWFSRLYEQVGFSGCSSHSGRRTFVTELARRANLHDKSLRDVQRLAGHRRLDTTQRYIQPADDLAALVASL